MTDAPNDAEKFADPVIDQMEEDCAVLQTLYEGYASDSKQYQAGKRAVVALSFVTLKYNEEFNSFLKKLKKSPTPEQLEHLKKF